MPKLLNLHLLQTCKYFFDTNVLQVKCNYILTSTEALSCYSCGSAVGLLVMSDMLTFPTPQLSLRSYNNCTIIDVFRSLCSTRAPCLKHLDDPPVLARPVGPPCAPSAAGVPGAPRCSLLRRCRGSSVTWPCGPGFAAAVLCAVLPLAKKRADPADRALDSRTCAALRSRDAARTRADHRVR